MKEMDLEAHDESCSMKKTTKEVATNKTTSKNGKAPTNERHEISNAIEQKRIAVVAKRRESVARKK
ncbi:hypothetical protein Leryth_025786 [Lithospermum erythrorhizon]|nr:hypothetical protein Leryth_025786 [Lithospermum erythrorhizon]